MKQVSLPEATSYQQMAKTQEEKRSVVTNVLRAFLVGGLISLLGQGLMWMYETFFGFTEKNASNPTVATLVFLSVLLTALGHYDKLGQWAGAGATVPVTGFANTMASTALDFRSEGLVLGVGGNMFKMAGPVIVFGVVSAFIIALIKTIWQLLV
ncbi:MAG: stage V sporulation protein AC [Candidatus Carbobacillus altaicus]|uniref:Stage V sporulation protein AC (SpoVAC) n=1 Tax=Candidatus Carbonibacillus altaicus TaxID=2163959 RepID=A0A2R6Y4B6_9BACL|nr:stage V sporulation protein AC [Candidatus Carbobacillus altaicus]PTQ57529.1 MAG: Stage V sporulation protein AC (SpoVAC) [Candidatus Carbobacillus altaicus]